MSRLDNMFPNDWKCDGKNHNLREMYSIDVGWNEEHVVRRCIDCGAVVIDRESDGRRFGCVVNMKFPRILEVYSKLRKDYLELEKKARKR